MHTRALSTLFVVGLIFTLLVNPVLAEQRPRIDFAQLMPPSTLIYAELRDPANHLEQLADAMGLIGNRSESDQDPVTIQLEDGFVLSSDFRISPSLLAELKRVRGAAVSLAAPLENGEPLPLVAIDPGESSLLRGLLETGIQVVPRADKIGGYPTYHHEEGKFWCVQTASLFVASSSRDHLVDAVKRVRGDGSSLADNQKFKQRRREADDALVFAFADGATLIEHAAPHMKGEAAIARAVLDLDHLECATAMIKATDSGARAQVRVSLDEDHNSLAYGMIRTVPFRREIFAKVPKEAAVVTAIGVNPPLQIQGEQSQHLTAFDIGRELFANLAEVAMFVLPSADAHNDEIPNVGLLVRANDAEKSESLWSQLLGLPAMLGSDDGPSVEKITVGGRKGHRYSFEDDDAPQLDMIRIDDETMVVGTQLAVESVLGLEGRRGSILGDTDLAQAINDAPEHASKAVFAHIGRLAALAAQMEGGNDAKELAIISRVLKHTKVVAVSDEAPHELTIQVEASELPVFEDVIRMVAEMQEGSRAPRGAVVHAE